MRVIFAGTPEFARVALERLHAAGHDIVLVLTQPDRPAGRGLKLQASAVKNYALAHNLPVAQPRSLRLDGKFPEEAAAAKEAIQAARAEVMVVAAYGLILPQWVLLDGERVDHLRDGQRSRLRASRFGFVFQDAVLDSTRTVLDNVLEAAPPRPRTGSASPRARRAPTRT